MFPHATKHKRNVPIPTTGMTTISTSFQHKIQPSSKRVRPDILLQSYILVGSHKSRANKHNFNTAFYVLGYLYTTQDLPLVLEGTSSVSIRSNANASLATGPPRCNILRSIVTLAPGSFFEKCTPKCTLFLPFSHNRVKVSVHSTDLCYLRANFKIF